MCQRVCPPSWHPSDNCAATSTGQTADAMKRFVRGHAEGKMLNEHLGGAIISLFRACGPKVLKMLMFVRVVNGNLPITRASRRGAGTGNE